MKKIILLAIIAFVIYSCKLKKDDIHDPNDDPPKDVYIDSKVSLISFGDNLIHDSIYKSARVGDTYDFSNILRDIKPFLENYDLRFINQETILGGTELGLSTYPCFNSPKELGDDLVESGFNLISLANNHTLDKGEAGVINSVNFWKTKEVVYSGSSLNEGSQVKLFERNGITFAFVAYTYGTNGISHPKGKMYLANLYTEEKVKRDIEEVRGRVDVIIVSMHWGEEYRNLPTEKQINDAKFLNSLGVNIIIGHHPHVIEPIDVIENEHKTVVMYSLGNFLSDQKGLDRLIGMGVSLEINKVYNKELNNGEYKIEINNIKAKLIYRYKDYINNSFRVLLFHDLNDYLLLNYEEYFIEKEKLIKYYYDDIEVY